MTSHFAIGTTDGITLSEGTPNCQAAHDALLAELHSLVQGQFLPLGTVPSERQKGNFGEWCALVIAHATHRKGVRAMPANSHPLSDVSRAEVDIVWLHFHDSDPQLDFIALQETKTTGDPSLSYGSTLIDDYKKLFGTSPGLTLHTRIQSIRMKLEAFQSAPLSMRLAGIVGRSPQTSLRVRLVPTVIHEKKGAAPVSKLTAIRTTLMAEGWSPDQIEAWSIALTDLNDRVTRICCGQP